MAKDEEGTTSSKPETEKDREAKAMAEVRSNTREV